jgi:SAM-dependent methyltransferase
VGRSAAAAVRVVEFVKRRARGVGHLVPAPLRRRLSDWLHARAQMSLPDRVFLESRVLPELTSGRFSKVLSIGVERYTAHQPELFEKAGVEFWTVDLEPERARFGAPGRHLVADVCRLHENFAPQTFDAVLFNGVIGFGVDDEKTADRAIESLCRVLKPGGWFVLGWNEDKGVQPLDLPSTRHHLEPLTGTTLPQTISFRGSTHRFDLLARNGTAAEPADLAGSA